jgi:hypothetical protein
MPGTNPSKQRNKKEEQERHWVIFMVFVVFVF